MQIPEWIKFIHFYHGVLDSSWLSHDTLPTGLETSVEHLRLSKDGIPELNILLVGSVDARHILKTMSQAHMRSQKKINVCNSQFYFALGHFCTCCAGFSFVAHLYIFSIFFPFVQVIERSNYKIQQLDSPLQLAVEPP